MFDPKQFLETAREQWNNAADDWHKWMNTLSDWIAPATREMFDMANMDSGQRVLDVAAGDGDQSMMAAERVGDEGYVLATDLSANLVDIIRKKATAAGISNLEAQEMNGERLEALANDSFDIVISRLGLMIFPNPLKGLKEMRRVLKPGGRKAALVFTTPEKSPFLSGPAMIAMRHAQMPPSQPSQPGPFALGAPGLLEKTFQEAGFQNIKTRIVSIPLRMNTATDCRNFLVEAGGFYRSLLSKLDDEARQVAVNEIDDFLQQFETHNGFVSPTEVVMAVGTK